MFGLADRLRRIRTVAARATPTPLMVRCAVYLAGLGAVLVAMPDRLLAGRLLPLFLLVALWPAIAPRGRAATVVILFAVAGWVMDTTWYSGSIELWRVLTLAALLYLLHTLAALAAVLPYDAIVSAGVPVHWLGRAAAVLLGSAVLIVAVLSVVGGIGGGVYLAVTVVGLAVAVGTAALLARLIRRP